MRGANTCTRSGLTRLRGRADPITRKPRRSGAFALQSQPPVAQSASVSSEALPPAAVVLIVIVFSVVKRGR